MENKFLSCVIAAALGVTAMTASLSSQAVSEGDTYEVSVSKERGKVTLGGTVVPYKDVTLSAQIPGRVIYLAGAEGSEFVKGTVLVAISEDELTAQREALEAAHASAVAQLRNAQIQHQHQLYGNKTNPMMKNTPMDWFSGMPGMTNNSGSYADRASTLANVQGAQSAVNAAVSKIQAVDAKLRDAKSVAPIDGVIVKKFAEVGDTVQPGQPLLRFSDIKFLQIKVEVPARQVEVLKKGMFVEARLDVQDKIVPVRVARVFPIAGDRHTVTVKLDLPQHSAAAPGMYAEVIIPDVSTETMDVARVPKSSVKWRGSLPQVYVMKNGRASLRAIRIGESSGAYYTVLSGIKQGDIVLLNPDRRTINDWKRK